MRLVVAVGFLGAYTTFSTFAMETEALARRRSDDARGSLRGAQRRPRESPRLAWVMSLLGDSVVIILHPLDRRRFVPAPVPC
jgi:hypothetical protein